MQLILISHGDLMAGGCGIITGPLATGLTETTGGGTQVAAGTAEVHAYIMSQLIKNLFQFFGKGTEQNHVTGGTVHIGHTAAAPVPDLADLP